MGTLGTNAVSININKDVEKYTEESILQALEMIGLKAESYAAMKCPVDTGLLRNSIAHAVAGEQPSIGASYKGTEKKARTYKADKPNENGEINQGTYTGHTPKKKGEYTVYVGTNVEYAAYVEMGHIQAGSGKHVPAKPYIKPAIVDHLDEYKQILENTLKEE